MAGQGARIVRDDFEFDKAKGLDRERCAEINQPGNDPFGHIQRSSNFFGAARAQSSWRWRRIYFEDVHVQPGPKRE